MIAYPLLQDPDPVTPKHPPVALVDRRHAYVQCTAEQAECTCPEFCERDHDND